MSSGARCLRGDQSTGARCPRPRGEVSKLQGGDMSIGAKCLVTTQTDCDTETTSLGARFHWGDFRGRLHSESNTEIERVSSGPLFSGYTYSRG